MCRYIIASVYTDTEPASVPGCKQISYVSVALDKYYGALWIIQIKSILHHCSSCLTWLKPENGQEFSCISLFLHMIVIFTSANSWPMFKQDLFSNVALRTAMNKLCSNVLNALVAKNFYSDLQSMLNKALCKSNPTVNKASLTAAITLSLRPLIDANFSPQLLKQFVANILTVPGFIHHLTQLTPETVQNIQSHRIFFHTTNFLCDEKASGSIIRSLEANYALCLLANLINLSYIDQVSLKECLIDHVVSSSFNYVQPLFISALSLQVVVDRLLERCRKYVSSKKSNLTHWHPILGYFAQNVDPGYVF